MATAQESTKKEEALCEPMVMARQQPVMSV